MHIFDSKKLFYFCFSLLSITPILSMHNNLLRATLRNRFNKSIAAQPSTFVESPEPASSLCVVEKKVKSLENCDLIMCYAFQLKNKNDEKKFQEIKNNFEPIAHIVAQKLENHFQMFKEKLLTTASSPLLQYFICAKDESTSLQPANLVFLIATNWQAKNPADYKIIRKSMKQSSATLNAHVPAAHLLKQLMFYYPELESYCNKTINENKTLAHVGAKIVANNSKKSKSL